MATTISADSYQALDSRGYRGKLIHGANPALLFEKAVRDRVTRSRYWMEECFGLNEATLCDRAVRLTAVGGTSGEYGTATPFLCLLFKMCVMVPDRDVVLVWLNWRGEDDQDEDEAEEEADEKKKGEFKYLRALAAFYIRLAWKPEEVYKTLEPILKDYRKLRRQTRDGFILTYMDQFIDDLLNKERVCGTSLKALPKREVLEELEVLEPVEEMDLDEFDVKDAPSDSEESYISREEDEDDDDSEEGRIQEDDNDE